ncbi:hypothetical protein [Nonomuraea endophytica]|uniref:hypothetical protein n=1 Tax=Nonomuraea endophytica TaxID=714136 RepID=UPI0037C87803
MRGAADDRVPTPPTGTNAPSPQAPADTDIVAGWRALGHRLLTTHPLATDPPERETTQPIQSRAVAEPTALGPVPHKAPGQAKGQGHNQGNAWVPAAEPVPPRWEHSEAPARMPPRPEDSPGLVIEHLEVHVVDPAPEPAAAPHRSVRRPAPSNLAGAWAPAARHYVERW